MRTFALAITFAFVPAVALMAGCGTPQQPPTVQMSSARASVDAANTAGAQTFAPAETRLANDKLTSAQKAMGEREYAVAQRMAEEAQVDAQLALARTQAAQARTAADQARSAAIRQAVEIQRNASPAAAGVTQ